MPGFKVAACDACATDPKYLCPSCGLVLRDAVQLSCSHHYCETCFSNMQRHNHPTCITCGQFFINMESFPDNFMRREMLCLNVTCKNKDDGCTWQGELQEIDIHHNTCPSRPITCGNQNCGESIPACRLTDHEEQECVYRQVVCEHCNDPETFGNLQIHLTTCPNVPVQCTSCGKENIPRNQVKCHTDALNGDCPRKSCPFREYGCAHDETMTQDGLNLHLMERLKEHLLLLLALVGANRHQHHCEELHPQVAGIKQDLCGAEVKLENHHWALDTHYSWLAKLGDDVKCLFEILARVEDKVAALQQENTELKNHIAAIDAREEDNHGMVVALQEENTELKNRLAALEMRADIHDDHDDRINAQVESQRAFQSSLLRQFQDVHCIGELVWVISDVSQKYAQARGNQEMFLISPPFYTSRSGYKVCIRLYMNGYGREWNSNNMSFFFLLMKGEFDAILEWPFSRRVELRVMGQGNRRGHDIVVAFRPDPQSASFARPVGGMNAVDGVPQCVFPLEVLRRDGYADDDTMFVKVVVDDK